MLLVPISWKKNWRCSFWLQRQSKRPAKKIQKKNQPPSPRWCVALPARRRHAPARERGPRGCPGPASVGNGCRQEGRWPPMHLVAVEFAEWGPPPPLLLDFARGVSGSWVCNFASAQLLRVSFLSIYNPRGLNQTNAHHKDFTLCVSHPRPPQKPLERG